MARHLSTPGLLLAAAVVCLTLLADAHIDRCFRHEVPEVPKSNFSKGVAKFSLTFFKRLVQRHTEGENVVVSPYSVWNALCLAYFGAQGRTKEQLAKALQLSTKSSTYSHWRFLQFILSSDGPAWKGSIKRRNKKGNSSSDRSNLEDWGSGGAFVSTSTAYFHEGLRLSNCLSSSLMEMQTLDFSRPFTAAQRINSDVSRTTRGMIQDLVDPRALANAQFVLLNAVFFKGSWQTQFPLARTTLRPFHATQDLELGAVPMMSVLSKFKYVYQTDLEASVVELPYESGFSLLVFLPGVGDRRVEAVVEKLSRRRLEVTRALMVEREVDVTLPRFSLTSRLTDQLIQVLGDLGIIDLFTEAANLRSFSKTDLHVSSAVHQASVHLSEEGTVAAAATGLLGTRVGPTKFVCDRPFVFLIVDDLMHVPVFAGVYNQPTDTL